MELPPEPSEDSPAPESTPNTIPVATKAEDSSTASKESGSKSDRKKVARKAATKSTKRAAKKAAKSTSKKTAKKTARNSTGGKQPFPNHSIDECRNIADKLKEVNAGNAWSPADIANALGIGTGDNFFYLTQSSRDYGLTTGTRASTKIELAEIGRRLVYPKNPEEESAAILAAFNNIPLFKNVYEYYQGNNLPEIEYLKNTLKTEFGVEEPHQDKFYKV